MKTFILHTATLKKAIEEIRQNGGYVTQICTQNIIVSNFPDKFDISVLNLSSRSIPEDIDDLSKRFIDAWNFDVQDKEIAVKKWDEEGYQYPRNRFNDKELAEQFEIYPPATSSYMIGDISVGLVIVSGQEPSLIFSEAEINNTIRQTMNGLQCLASFEPLANITFVYETSLLSIDTQPPTSCSTTEGCESTWRDPALKLLGCSIGLAGVGQYNSRMITETDSRWAFTAFFTKYPQGYFAYAGSGRICMEYSNDGWGPTQINKVLAHETCHIFGAADEYAKSNCTCADSGYYKVPNYNCENCSSGFTKVSCLMNVNDLSNLCQWSRGQLGWPYSVKLSKTTLKSPALTAMNNTLYFAWKAEGNNNICIASSRDGIKWTASTQLAKTTIESLR